MVGHHSLNSVISTFNSALRAVPPSLRFKRGKVRKGQQDCLIIRSVFESTKFYQVLDTIALPVKEHVWNVSQTYDFPKLLT